MPVAWKVKFTSACLATSSNARGSERSFGGGTQYAWWRPGNSARVGFSAKSLSPASGWYVSLLQRSSSVTPRQANHPCGYVKMCSMTLETQRCRPISCTVDPQASRRIMTTQKFRFSIQGLLSESDYDFSNCAIWCSCKNPSTETRSSYLSVRF